MARSDFEHLETVLAKALGGIAARGGNAAPLAPVWERLVGPLAAARCRPSSLVDGILTVRCETEAWRAALRPRLDALAAELRRAVAPARLESIRLEVT